LINSGGVVPRQQNGRVLVAVAGEETGGFRLCPLDPLGRPAGDSAPATDLPTTVAARERAERPRWLWAATAEVYPVLLAAGVRVERCHDVELTEALLLGHAGRWGEPRSLAAAWARLTGAPVPPDPPPRPAAPPGDRQGALFDEGAWTRASGFTGAGAYAAEPASPAAAGADAVKALIEVYADQRARIDATEHPGRFRLLVAAECAGALIAAEVGRAGLPWRADIHRALLAELLGEPSPVGGPPRRLAELSAAIGEAFGDPRLHPDSPAEVLRALRRAGVDVPNTRSWVLRTVDHPAVPLLLEYKELYRIWTAHGWSWLDTWVHDGRFRAEYVPGGVVSGRWATRGGGALQIPKVVRRAVVADPGWRLVVADAGQLEPRVLAAVSGDERFAAAGAAGDLYAALAGDAFAGDRAKAKVAMLGAMYGQTGGNALPALATLRRNYPTAFDYVESAARTGEAGGLVRSWLGRTCPPASAGLSFAPVDGEPAGDERAPGGERAGPAARARGRFTRNFVIQATAAEWALTLLASLRPLLAGAGELVFFQHDEVLVHCPAERADAVVAAVHEAGERARRLLFGETAVRFPLDTRVVECYADAK
jgi:DNA polymerase-1